ncbi:MAG: class I SAM-dependent methyltransferase [Acidobacteriia bacterium]|nr:class I SAM-dependent methyltransferase [Terriglobia bacterium]
MPFSYDEVVYPGLPYGQTHPSRLASLGTLFGMNPAPVGRCRVLEIACGNGGNLVPMAFELEHSEFLGIDLAETAIEAGRREIAELGLGNVRLERMDVMEAGPGLGTFDYIIAHGFYSWVPAPVREKLLEVVRDCLAPQGVAYVSYNALPGCRIRELLRETMLFHARGAGDPAARVDRGRQILQWLTESYCAPGISRGFLKDEAQSMLDRAPQFLYHDEMAEVFYPVYFQDFAAHAARLGLQYLSEANYFDTQPGKIPEAIAGEVRRIAGCDRILEEQYYDLLKCRMFRQTLLCHSGAAGAQPIAGRISGLFAASSATPVSPRPEFGDKAEEFVGPRGSSAKTAHPLAKAALFTLGQAWPEGIPFPDLLAAASRLAGDEESPEPDASATVRRPPPWRGRKPRAGSSSPLPCTARSTAGMTSSGA